MESDVIWNYSNLFSKNNVNLKSCITHLNISYRHSMKHVIISPLIRVGFLLKNPLHPPGGREYGP